MPETKELPVVHGRILVADDDPENLKMICRLLESEGHICVGVSDGPAAERALGGESFDLLISDIEMPGNRGLELIERAPQIVDGLAIILLTGHPTVSTAMQSVRLPVIAYLEKPADPGELRRLVAEAVADAKAFRSLAASRQRLLEWAADLEKIEKALRKARRSRSPVPINSYLQVTLQNLSMILMDWKEVMESSITPKSPQQQPVVAALHETISVLEKTKRSFKSRELGELRQKLEDLLGAPGKP